MNDIEKLVARVEIEDCLKRYARGVDRKDWDVVRSCFHCDAVDHHGEFNGGPEAFIEWVGDRHASVPFSMHYLLNCLVEFTGEHGALVETYFWAIQRRDATATNNVEPGVDHEVFGRYVDLFEKRDGAWRIARRKVTYDSTRTQSSTNHLRKLVGVLGSRDRNDPIYEVSIAAE